LLVGDFSSSLHPIPRFASLEAQPDPSLSGTVAYNALSVGSPQGKKWGRVDVVPASGGPSKQLFCASQPKALGAALSWLPDGRLQATNRGQDHWRKIVNVRTGTIKESPWVKPPDPTTSLATGPKGEKVTVSTSRGTLHVTLASNSGYHELLTVGVPPDYTINNLEWSPDGQ
jgi:hypothetical protein